MGGELIAGGLSLLGSIIGGNEKKDAARKAANAQQAGIYKSGQQLTDAYGQASQDLRTGQSGYEQSLQPAIGGYQPYQNAGQQSLQTYMDYITGAAVPEESAMFKYQSRLLDRGLSGGGKGISPTSQTIGLMPLIAQEEQRQFDRLKPIINTGMTATQGLSGLYNNIGVSRNTLGTNLGNYKTSLGTNMANLTTQGGDIQASKHLANKGNFGELLRGASQNMGGFFPADKANLGNLDLFSQKTQGLGNDLANNKYSNTQGMFSDMMKNWN